MLVVIDKLNMILMAICDSRQPTPIAVNMVKMESLLVLFVEQTEFTIKLSGQQTMQKMAVANQNLIFRHRKIINLPVGIGKMDCFAVYH
ncbi:hypothetical protein Xenpb_02509 [Xenorhabdus sp. PB62.4]|nr:hypothetical protein [Xenorhabdus sp. PB62.4]